jgi:hypothetical protein
LTFKYYLWALSEKTVSYVPFGRKLAIATYDFLSRERGKSQSFWSSFRLVRKVKELIPHGGHVMDVGTAWFHHDAFLIYLLGDYTTYLFDIEDRAKLRYIKNYLRYLLSNRDLIRSELGVSHEEMESKLSPLLALDSRKDIYQKCNFVPCITHETDKPFLPEESIDFIVGNCVLNHIKPQVLIPELHTLRRMLKANGHMYFLIGHDDHWTFHDRSANMFNYYRYSDAYYRLIFETNIEYHNRMVKQEWLELFRRCQLSVKEYYAYITEQSRSEIGRLPHIDSRFAKYSLEDLSILYSYVLLTK